jgi:hypothetical protein
MADKIKAVIREVGKITAAVGGRDTTPAKWRGKWQPEERYGVLHKVEHLGSSYVCIKACVGVDPEADVTLGDGVEGQYWILIAAKGKDGSDGEDGAAFTYDMFTQEQLEGLRGPEGPRGYSPTVNATPTSAGVQLTIKNYDEASGMETITYANVKNGNPGLPGSPGAAGVKGDSCNIRAAETDEGVELTITNTEYTNSGASNNVQKVLVKNGEGGAPEVFIATYGETPFADIRAAYDAGKACFCKSANGKSVYTLLTISSAAANFAGSYTYGARIIAAREVDGETTWTDTQYKFVREDGGKMTGALTLSGDPTENLHAATKQYVDNKLEENVDLMGGVAPEWNDVKNKPFDENNVIKPEALPEGYPYKEGVSIEWDGNTDGLEAIILGASESSTTGFYRLSDTPISDEVLKKATVTTFSGGETVIADEWDTMVADGAVTEDFCMAAQGFLFVVKKANANAAGITFEKPGIYSMKISSESFTNYVTKLDAQTIHPMASEYLKLGNGLTVDENGAIALALPNAEGGSF